MLDVTASAKPAAPKTVTTKHLAYALAEQHQLGKKQSLEMMEEFVGMITKHLKKGERVKIAGLGILVVRNRAARMGRNPMTGEPIQIKASKKVAFRATKELKMAIWSPGAAALFMPTPRPARDQIAARAYFLSKTGRPILPATSFFRPDARQIFHAIMAPRPATARSFLET